MRGSTDFRKSVCGHPNLQPVHLNWIHTVSAWQQKGAVAGLDKGGREIFEGHDGVNFGKVAFLFFHSIISIYISSVKDKIALCLTKCTYLTFLPLDVLYGDLFLSTKMSQLS